jgi:hypothetical protein
MRRHVTSRLATLARPFCAAWRNVKGTLEPFCGQWHKGTMDEEQLVLALRRGDTAAAQELVRSCGDRLLRSAFLLCGNETEAQDLVQGF